jgi:hypothetical protein
MKTFLCAVVILFSTQVRATPALESLNVPRQHLLAVVPVTPNVASRFPVAGTQKKAEIDLSAFVVADTKWQEGDEAIVRIDAEFSYGNSWFRNWLHYKVTVFVGDGRSELPFEAKGTIVAGGKGLRDDNSILKQRLADAVAPAFVQASNYLLSGK